MGKSNQQPEPEAVVDDPQQLGIEDALEQEPESTLPAPDPSDVSEQQPEGGEQDETAPEPLTPDQLALMIADLDETERREFVQALDVLVDVDHGKERPSREGIKAGDYVELDGHAYVRFPDGTVVTASRQLLAGQPGEYVVEYWGEGQGSETFTVAEKDADA